MDFYSDPNYPPPVGSWHIRIFANSDQGEDATTRVILLIRSIDVSIDVLTELLSLYCKAIRRVSVLFTALKAKGYLIKTKGYSYEG